MFALWASAARLVRVLIPPSPGRRKLRMLRGGDRPADQVVVVRATPATIRETIEAVVSDAAESGRTYTVPFGADREVLFGISVFARRPGVGLVDVLARFDTAPCFIETTVGTLHTGGFAVFATGVNPDHYDVQLVAGRSETDPEPTAELRAAAERLVEIAGGLHANPAYFRGTSQTPEGW